MKACITAIAAAILFFSMSGRHAEAFWFLDLLVHEEDRIERIEYHDYDDWTDDFYVSEIQYFRYNAEGKVEVMDVDMNADGQIDLRLTFSYNAEGRLERMDRAFYDDDIFFGKFTYTNGRLVKAEYDHIGDSLYDEVAEFKYDPSGKLLEIERFEDGEFDYLETFEYNTDGKLEKLVMGDGEGSVYEVDYYFYHPDGRLKRIDTKADEHSDVERMALVVWASEDDSDDDGSNGSGSSSSSSGCFMGALSSGG